MSRRETHVDANPTVQYDQTCTPVQSLPNFDMVIVDDRRHIYIKVARDSNFSNDCPIRYYTTEWRQHSFFCTVRHVYEFTHTSS